MSNPLDDRLLRKALRSQPSAPEDPTFARRVMATIAVTPQSVRDPLQEHSLSIPLRLTAAFSGFAAGLLIIVLLLPSSETTSSTLVFDPIETLVAEVRP